MAVNANRHRFSFTLLRLSATLCASLSVVALIFVGIGSRIPTHEIMFNGGNRDNTFYLMDVNQRVVLRIYRDSVNYPASIAWSPDGTQFAFVQEMPYSDVYVINLADGIARNLTNTDTLDDAPTWLDDDRIAFWSWRDAGLRRMYTVNIHTGDTQPLTEPMIPNADARFTLSPDGQRYALATWRHGDSEIYVRDLTATESVRLTDNPAFDYNPAWSPDGTQLAFWTTRDNNQMRLYIMNADGSDQHPVTPGLSSGIDMDWSVTWSPSGDTLAFIASYEARPAIYTVAATGGDIHRVRFFDGSYTPSLAWRPQ